LVGWLIGWLIGWLVGWWLVDAATSKTEEEFLTLANTEQLQDGSTTVTAAIIGNSLYVANVGDSELIVCRGNEARVLTHIHNPVKNPEEIDRIKRAGGRLHNNRVGHPYLNAQFFSLGVSKAMYVLKEKRKRERESVCVCVCVLQLHTRLVESTTTFTCLGSVLTCSSMNCVHVGFDLVVI
jgi:serine/threonine protein phosphatase PrpC